MTRISFHYHYYTPAEWQEKLSARGLRVKEWEYYFSQSAHRVFDLSHYLSAPSVLVHRLTGRWILFPNKPGVRLQEAILRPLYNQRLNGDGAYILLACVKDPGAVHAAGTEADRG